MMEDEKTFCERCGNPGARNCPVIYAKPNLGTGPEVHYGPRQENHLLCPECVDAFVKERANQ